jgi:hypothetical protein
MRVRSLVVVLVFVSAAALVTVACGDSPTAPGNLPVITSLYADAAVIAPGTQTTLHWTVEYADQATRQTLTPVVGDVQASGSTVVAPRVTTVYTLTVTRGVYQVSRQVTLTVT